VRATVSNRSIESSAYKLPDISRGVGCPPVVAILQEALGRKGVALLSSRTCQEVLLLKLPELIKTQRKVGCASDESAKMNQQPKLFGEAIGSSRRRLAGHDASSAKIPRLTGGRDWSMGQGLS
jgi:hypothetical protein